MIRNVQMCLDTALMFLHRFHWRVQGRAIKEDCGLWTVDCGRTQSFIFLLTLLTPNFSIVHIMKEGLQGFFNVSFQTGFILFYSLLKHHFFQHNSCNLHKNIFWRQNINTFYFTFNTKINPNKFNVMQNSWNSGQCHNSRHFNSSRPCFKMFHIFRAMLF